MATDSPEDAVKVSGEGMTLIEFDVTPNASETRVPDGFNEWRGRFEARLSEPAQDGRANEELLDELELLIGVRGTVTKGKTGSKKTVAVDADRESVLDILVRHV